MNTQQKCRHLRRKIKSLIEEYENDDDIDAIEFSIHYELLPLTFHKDVDIFSHRYTSLPNYQHLITMMKDVKKKYKIVYISKYNQKIKFLITKRK